MTSFVLAWARPSTTLDPAVAKRLEVAISPAGRVWSAAMNHLAVAAWDSALWPGPSIVADASAGVIVAGDPVVRVGTQAFDRSASVAGFRSRLLTDATALLCTAEGTYASVAWESNGRALVCTDKLGVRPEIGRAHV